MSLHKFLQTFLFLFLSISYSQELPPINVFSAKDYGAENQNWSITQASNKFIYVANNKGLLEYNGAKWTLYPTPNETIIRSAEAYKDKVYTGFYMDFGFWKKNNLGVLEYTSIAKENNIEFIEDEQIWNIVEFDGWMLFKSLERIYLYNLNTNIIKIIESDHRMTKLTKVEETLYFQELYKGIFKIENGIPKLISDNQILKDNIIVDIFFNKGELLFLTQSKGFFILKDGKVKQWDIKSNDLILSKTFYSAKQLRNKNFVLGSISDGIINIDIDGNFNYQIAQSSGLSNNTVLSIFEDSSHNIWLGLDNGINCINNKSAFKMYLDNTDFWGTIYTSVVHNNFLYLGTNQGLYYKKYGSDDKFKFVENTQGQVWNLIAVDDDLFCGHDSGTFLIKTNVAKQIANIPGTWDIKKIDDKTLLQGNYEGLYILENNNNNWNLKNKIQGYNSSSKNFEIVDSNSILMNHGYKSVLKLLVDKNFEKIVSLEKDTNTIKGVNSSLVKYNNKVLYASRRGVYAYTTNTGYFELDTIYSELISKENFTSGKLVHDEFGQKLWSFSGDDIKYIEPGKLSDKPILKKIPIPESLRKGASGYENITHLIDKKYLIGSSDGFLTLDLENITKPEKFEVSINNVNSFLLNKPKKLINLSESIEFKNEENNIEFFFSVPNYSKTSVSKYQYQLIGQNPVWSNWNESNSVLFDNLRYGEYTFKVRGKVGNKLSVNLDEFSFKIQKPWYLSNLFIALYIVLFLLFSFITHFLQNRYYKKQREKLFERNQKELELKELESSQKIIKLRNEKLRSDIDSKNRELATSTMSIIKKNEFLNDIKSELINGDVKSITNVVKIIDKNLNNTDDWKLFQEAFNNADKKFIKKVKSKHPDLTPNDLRLCAYLRLNLSSKEIAPLLNISHRSVEVKRYRLRKKIDLPHNLNLTNYILEI
jgi:DNA-binding CsgD family transcriptional regulator